MIKEIKSHDLNTEQFIAERVSEIRAAVGDGTAINARTATPTRLPFEVLEEMASAILSEVPGVVSVTYNIATKPPSTIEAV